ncbi:MAG: hypothetical protein IJQ93_00110 [Bacteroidales bacterium]|nr:hypothetical protein [Bacteroidales bacterium]
MQSIDDKILTNVKKRGRGTIFFAQDMLQYGQRLSVLKALERMAAAGTILRVARGIYCYPKIDKQLGLGALYPSLDEIAQAVAKRDKARIAPTGAYALNILGLSTQVQMNVVYLTDGTARRLTIGNGKGILFKHTAPKNLAFRSRTAMYITFALKELGQEGVTQAHIDRIRELVKAEKKENILADAALIPSWIMKILRNAV